MIFFKFNLFIKRYLLLKTYNKFFMNKRLKILLKINKNF
jgi:hypothetical protein